MIIELAGLQCLLHRSYFQRAASEDVSIVPKFGITFSRLRAHYCCVTFRPNIRDTS